MLRAAEQEIAQPELQPMALEAKAAAALLKYVPLPADLLSAAVAHLATGAAADLWAARAAALVFAQVPRMRCQAAALPAHMCILAGCAALQGLRINKLVCYLGLPWKGWTNVAADYAPCCCDCFS